MALIICTECGKKFSDRAVACPNCGCPTVEIMKDLKVQIGERKTTSKNVDSKILPPIPEEKRCPYCGEAVKSGDDYCDSCGQRLVPYASKVTLQSQSSKQNVFVSKAAYTICPSCGTRNPSAKFTCSRCGHKYSVEEYNAAIVVPECASAPPPSSPVRKHVSAPKSESSDPVRKYVGPPKPVSPSLTCRKCGGYNIQVTLNAVKETGTGKSEVRKKSIVTRTANTAGRAGLILATGGLWALTPKKSKYTENFKETTKIHNQKICICQDCGFSWQIF